MLVREGKAMVELQNTLVHETLHAFMDDFNRTGMVSATNLRDVIESEIPKSKMQEYNERYAALKFPKWFIEGTASAVENVYQYRYDLFQVLRRAQGEKGYGTGKLNDSFTAQDVLNNYIFAKYANGEKVWFDIGMSDAVKDANGDEVDTSASRYVTGYLATLYLCNLAAIKVEGKSAVQVNNGITTVDADLLSTGYDALLHTLHYGRSLDEAILRLSPKDANGNPLYKSTNDFTAKFIKGPLDGDT